MLIPQIRRRTLTSGYHITPLLERIHCASGLTARCTSP